MFLFLVAIYLFIDAPKHGKNKWLWSILGLLFGLFAFWDIPHQNRKKGLGWPVLIVSIIIYSIVIIVYVFYFLLLIFGYSNAS
ncbi:hypothetical protein ACEQPO_08795 [Bacillus sp. SL00103]